MRKVQLFTKKSDDDIKNRLFKLNSRLIQHSEAAAKKSSSGITYFKKIAAANNKRYDQKTDEINEVENQIRELYRKKSYLENERTAIWNRKNEAERAVNYKEFEAARSAKISTTVELSDEMLMAITAGLRGLSDFISDEVPVVVKPEYLSFRTKDIYIFDRDGRTLPFNFGSFDVLVTTVRGYDGVFQPKIKVFGAEDGDLDRGDTSYPHPHLCSDEAKPCLGKVVVNGTSMYTERFICNELLPVYDIVGIISLFRDYFVNYNGGDAYKKLEYYVGPNKWDHASHFCDCGKYKASLAGEFSEESLAANNFEPCDCLTSVDGQKIESKDELAPCGSTWGHCLSRHTGCASRFPINRGDNN